MAQQSRADLFGTFLESVRRREATRHSTHPRHGGEWLLAVLHGSGPRPVSELLVESHLSLSDFVTLINAMRAIDLITVEWQAGNELIGLTPVGQQAAQVPR